MRPHLDPSCPSLSIVLLLSSQEQHSSLALLEHELPSPIFSAQLKKHHKQLNFNKLPKPNIRIQNRTQHTHTHTHTHLASLSCLVVIIKLRINTLSINKTNHRIKLTFPYLLTATNQIKIWPSLIIHTFTYTKKYHKLKNWHRNFYNRKFRYRFRRIKRIFYKFSHCSIKRFPWLKFTITFTQSKKIKIKTTYYQNNHNESYIIKNWNLHYQTRQCSCSLRKIQLEILQKKKFKLKKQKGLTKMGFL